MFSFFVHAISRISLPIAIKFLLKIIPKGNLHAVFENFVTAATLCGTHRRWNRVGRVGQVLHRFWGV